MEKKNVHLSRYQDQPVSYIGHLGGNLVTTTTFHHHLSMGTGLNETDLQDLPSGTYSVCDIHVFLGQKHRGLNCGIYIF